MLHFERDTLASAQSRHQQVEKLITQRLKWAAGANPTLSQTLQQFEDALSDNTSMIEVQYIRLVFLIHVSFVSK